MPHLKRPRSMAGLVDLYLDSRHANKRLVSVADAVRAVKTAAPWCNLNDADLKEIVAQRAIFRRLDIAFDLTEDPDGKKSEAR
jgi:hypothetical protein